MLGTSWEDYNSKSMWSQWKRVHADKNQFWIVSSSASDFFSWSERTLDDYSESKRRQNLYSALFKPIPGRETIHVASSWRLEKKIGLESSLKGLLTF